MPHKLCIKSPTHLWTPKASLLSTHIYICKVDRGRASPKLPSFSTSACVLQVSCMRVTIFTEPSSIALPLPLNRSSSVIQALILKLAWEISWRIVASHKSLLRSMLSVFALRQLLWLDPSGLLLTWFTWEAWEGVEFRKAANYSLPC